MVGLASGLVLGNLGFTHCSIEDVGVLRSIPNILLTEKQVHLPCLLYLILHVHDLQILT